MQKKYIAILAALVAVVASPASLKAADVSVGADVNSAYVWRGITFNDEAVVQPSLDVSTESGLGLNVWGNFDLTDGYVETDMDFSEVDLTVSYALPVEAVDLSVGLIEYLFPNGDVHAEHVAAASTREVYGSAGYNITEALSVGASVYYDFDEADGFYGNLSTALAIPVSEKLGLEVGASLGMADYDEAEESGLHEYNLSVSGTYAASETVELGGFLAYTDAADDDVLPEQEVDVYGGVSATVAL